MLNITTVKEAQMWMLKSFLQADEDLKSTYLAGGQMTIEAPFVLPAKKP